MPRSASIERILEASPPRLGPFRILTELGEGGFAPVFLASEEYGGVELRSVALKLFALDDLATQDGTEGSPSSRERILAEARALCRVEHPNVVRFFQLIEDPSGSVLGLAMEHVRGRSLGDRLDAERTLPLDATLEVGAAMASALAAVHGAGLVHRDVKPGNVIDAGGVYKLIDFGIAAPARREPRTSARGLAAARSGPASARGASAPFSGRGAPASAHGSIAPSSARVAVVPSADPSSAHVAIVPINDPSSAHVAIVPVPGPPSARATVVSPRDGATARSAREAIGAPRAPTAGELIELASRDTAAHDRTQRLSAEPGEGTDALAGTMGYIDPACLSHSEPANAASDLYALGATLFECLTGRLPASLEGDGDSLTRIRMDVALGMEPPPPVRELAPRVPEAVARLIDSLVAPRRAQRPQRAEWVACELERLRRLERGAARELPLEGPFRGLEAFDARHRDVYFGRATDVAGALELLRSRGLLALVGPSGSGKSSLARAGVLPAIGDGSLGAWPARWVTVTLSPDAYPRAALQHALGPLLEGAPMPDDPDDLAAQLAATVEATSVGIVVLVDALEELVTLAAAEERPYLARFLAALAARPMPGLRAVVTARRDLLDPLLGVPGLGVALSRAVQLVAPLSAAAWADVVDERLAAYGFAIEAGAMRAELAGELASIAEAMPLVEFGLARLWEHRDLEHQVLSRSSLVSIGGLAGALARHAESTLDALSRARGAGAANVARRVLLALTTPHGTRATRTRADLAREIPDPMRLEVLAALEKARLVVTEGDRSTLAHEALIARWPRLRAWVEDERRDRELARDIEEAAARWRAQPGTDLLLRGRSLREARALLDSQRTPLSEGARAFVVSSRRNELRSSAGVVGLVGSVFVFAAVLGVSYVISERETRARQLEAEHEKTEIAKITRTLVQAASRPQTELERDIEAMVVARHACETALNRCQQGDAGSPAPPAR